MTSETSAASHFANDASSTGAARRLVTEVLERWDLAELAEVASLLVSELASDALLHAGTPSRPGDGHRCRPRAGRLGPGPGGRSRRTTGGDRGHRGRPGCVRAAGGGAVSAGTGADATLTIEIVGLPLRLYRQASEHSDGLFREFALIHRSEADEHGVPARLLRLIDDLRVGFGSFTAQPTAALGEALARGDDRVDLVYRVPPQAKEASIELLRLLDEADAFCRAGQHLLTLATPPGPVAFRQWFLGEFVAQVDGAPPARWDDFVGPLERRAGQLSYAGRSGPPPRFRSSATAATARR